MEFPIFRGSAREKQWNMYADNMLHKGCMSKGCVCTTIRSIAMSAYEDFGRAIFMLVTAS
jgi:hypothetical protein